MTIESNIVAYNILQLISIYFLFYSIYWVATLAIGAFYKERKPKVSTKLDDRWLIVLPAYSPNSTFLEVITKIRENRPNDIELEVYVLFQNTTSKFIDSCYQKLEFLCNHKSFGKMKGNSYINALKFICYQIENDNKLKDFDPTHVILLDKDNIIADDFFEKMIGYRKAGYDLIQGRRLPFSSQNGVASYDQISEALNDMMMRQYRVVRGWLPELSGSGFLVSKSAFISGINSLDVNNPGMDKNLLINWLINNEKINACYTESTIVYEEKTDDLEVLGAQRTRWFAEQYQTLGTYFWRLLLNGFRHFRLEVLDYIVALSRPPRSIHLLLVPILFLLEFLIFKKIGANLISFAFIIIGVVIFLTKKKLWKAAFQVLMIFPSLIFSNLKSILNIGSKTKGNFIHTERSNDK